MSEPVTVSEQRENARRNGFAIGCGSGNHMNVGRCDCPEPVPDPVSVAPERDDAQARPFATLLAAAAADNDRLQAENASLVADLEAAKHRVEELLSVIELANENTRRRGERLVTLERRVDGEGPQVAMGTAMGLLIREVAARVAAEEKRDEYMRAFQAEVRMGARLSLEHRGAERALREIGDLPPLIGNEDAQGIVRDYFAAVARRRVGFHSERWGGHVEGCEFTTDTGWVCAAGCEA